MATGDQWNVSNPEKPWTLWDPDANIVIPIFVDDWLAKLGVAYGGHSIIATDPLLCAGQGLYLAGIIGVRMALSGAPFEYNHKYPFTIRITGADLLTQDDRTLWLKIKER